MLAPIIAGLMSLAALQGQTEAPAPSTSNEEIVVIAPEREAVLRTVAAMSAPGGPQRTIPRWTDPVCPGVVGMAQEPAQQIADRIAEVALGLGLRVGAEECEPNIVIVYTRSADALAQDFAGNRNMATGGLDFRSTRGRDELQAFAETPAPVRWWHLSDVRRRDGVSPIAGMYSSLVGTETPIRSRPNKAGPQGMGTADMERQTLGTQTGSRIRRDTISNLVSAFLIVDASRTNGFAVSSVADYLALVTLAQLDPQADLTGSPSILSMFAGGSHRQLTDWDQAYLHGLYHAPNNSMSERQQEMDITDAMLQRLSTNAH